MVVFGGINTHGTRSGCYKYNLVPNTWFNIGFPGENETAISVKEYRALWTAVKTWKF